MPHTPDFPESFDDEEFSIAARHASDNRECIRLLGLSFLQKGFSEGEVAKLLDVHPQSVFNWLSSYKEGGIEALKDKGGRGRKNKMNKDHQEEFKKAVLNLQDQKEGGRITGRDVKEMMKKDFDIECANSTMYKIMHKVGLSWISGRTRHPKQDLEAQKTFKKTSKT